VDLKMGLFQIKMDPESAHLTTSTGPRVSFQYKRMAMGYKESPITFMRVIELAMAELSRDVMEIYLDDIMMFSESPYVLDYLCQSRMLLYCHPVYMLLT
jgi:hypothetical protein